MKMKKEIRKEISFYVFPWSLLVFTLPLSILIGYIASNSFENVYSFYKAGFIYINVYTIGSTLIALLLFLVFSKKVTFNNTSLNIKFLGYQKSYKYVETKLLKFSAINKAGLTLFIYVSENKAISISIGNISIYQRLLVFLSDKEVEVLIPENW